MLPLDLVSSLGGTPRILCLGAHPDDIEIGCGGTILTLARSLPGAVWRWVTFTGNETRHAEARASLERFLGPGPADRLRLESFRDGFLPYHAAAVKDCFEGLKREFAPDLIFTHQPDDRHQDHRLVCELTWNTWRNHWILQYEIPKYDGDLGQPQAFLPIARAVAEEKTAILLDVYATQRGKEWFDRDLLMGLMRIRGMECNAPERHAEAFYARKWTLRAEPAR